VYVVQGGDHKVGHFLRDSSGHGDFMVGQQIGSVGYFPWDPFMDICDILCDCLLRRASDNKSGGG
jgi:hypothetical protein